ncbi:hypothetical protein HWQ46_26815 [Shewanella sp. D64]|uniref:hypothetical protein n=1 Tax=unclassified Shewanella TaxID=196818 RepID=UPI0022BA3EA4|nr:MULTISPECIES: hypothetical protein [unclassified Shewanella]MEC4729120.1 hypothetical protein [Shewanella sp. D64]MEC4740909.1 hypothetical protein [Shewanella sp. E94]WBJ96240.1 hypothetical protein HWQ47_03680 [Shewanella sp. MTB7]
MNNFLNYPEPLYFEIENDYKKEIVALFSKLIEEEKWLKLISVDNKGVVKVEEDIPVKCFCSAFLFSKLDSLGEAPNLYLLINSKFSCKNLQEILCKVSYQNFVYTPSLQECLVEEVGGSLIFRDNDSDRLVAVNKRTG